MTIQLPPDTNDLKITFTIPKEIVPYVTNWYNRTKKPTDTPATFLLRLIKNMALAQRASDVEGELIKTTQATTSANQEELQTLIEQ